MAISALDSLFIMIFSEESLVKFNDVMKFITGSSSIPPGGLQRNLSTEFVHGCAPLCKCLPTISTCSLTVRLPVHLTSEEEMKAAFSMAIAGEVGINCC